MELTTSGLVWRNWADVEVCFRGSLGEVHRTVAVVSKMPRTEWTGTTAAVATVVSFGIRGASMNQVEATRHLLGTGLRRLVHQVLIPSDEEPRMLLPCNTTPFVLKQLKSISQRDLQTSTSILRPMARLSYSSWSP